MRGASSVYQNHRSGTQTWGGLCALTSELLVVAGHGPLSLLDHLLDRLADLGAGSEDVLGGELVEWPGRLDVGEGGLEVLKLDGDLLLGSLGLLGLQCVACVMWVVVSVHASVFEVHATIPEPPDGRTALGI